MQATYPPTVGCHLNISPTHKNTQFVFLFTQLRNLPCLNLCFSRKLLPILRSRPTFKLVIIILLEGDISLNPGPAVRRNIRLATTNVLSVRDKTASLSDLFNSKTIDIDQMIQSHALPKFLLLVTPSIIDYVHFDEVVVLAIWYQNSSKLIYILTLNNLVLNPSVLTFQILLSTLISSVFIALQDTQPIALRNSRICWKIWLLCIQNFIFCYDFNLHLDIPSAITTIFNDILVSFELKQQVTFSTHIHRRATGSTS